MKGRWVDEDAAAIADDVGLCAYASRLLGADPTLVLAGGGNSSVKTTEADVFGDPVEVLHVKGSGWDMAGLQPAGLAPLRLATVARLAELPELSDARMAAELRAACLDPAAPAPSVESILHAILPFRFVLHTHADAVLALTEHARRRGPGPGSLRRRRRGRAVRDARLRAGPRRAPRRSRRSATPGRVGMVLLNHGLFTFADDARTAYENHLALVDRALARLEAAERGDTTTETAERARRRRARHRRLRRGRRQRVRVGLGCCDRRRRRAEGGTGDDPGTLGAIAGLRRDISRVAGAPMILRTVDGDAAQRLVRRSDLATVTQVGPATPDHVLRTKRVPLVGRDVAGYARDYQAYVARNRGRLGDRAVLPVDPAPRVVLDPDLGALVAGRRVADAAAAAEIVDHTAWVIEQAQPLGGYVTPSEADIFDVEYWELEQAKLARQPAPVRPVGPGGAGDGGRVRHRPGHRPGASGRGRRGRGLDLDDPAGVADGADFVGVQGDATDPATVDLALGRGGPRLRRPRRAGGQRRRVPPAAAAGRAERRRVGRDARRQRGRRPSPSCGAAHPFLRLSPVGGSVVVVASKNVPAPGTGRGGLLGLEGGADPARPRRRAGVGARRHPGQRPPPRRGVRHRAVDRRPDRRAGRGYGLTPEQYRRRNVLGAEVKSAHVAAARRGPLRPHLRPHHGGADPRRRGQRARDLTARGRVRTSSRTRGRGAT